MLQFILLLLELIEIGSETVELIDDVIELLGGADVPDYSELTLEQKTEILKACTKTVANLGLDLACFPMGLATTIMFDVDGNPLP